jgi:hypothetical protein
MLLDWERGVGRDEERRDGRSDVGHGAGMKDSDEARMYDALKDDRTMEPNSVLVWTSLLREIIAQISCPCRQALP